MAKLCLDGRAKFQSDGTNQIFFGDYFMMPAASERMDAFSQVTQIMNGTRRWFAVHTASNHEKSVAQRLRAKDVEIFLPLYSVTKRWKNRTKAKVDLPLFAGYVFARIGPGEKLRVVEVPMVYSIVGVKGHPTALPDAEIESLRAGLIERQARPYPYATVGKRVRIRSGPLAGLEGTVIRVYGGLNVVLTIEMIHKSVAVHVEADELEPCPE
jgi:transcription antitermination factor NusG